MIYPDSQILLGVNIDHIATLRQARGTIYPDPIQAALISEEAGASGITLHLREDRRHIQDRDVFALKDILQTKMNLEMAVTDEMIEIASKVKPHDCCLVPEKREELTTEGGLDVIGHKEKVKDACQRLADVGVQVSLFIDADPDQIETAAEIGAPIIEIHTGHYADVKTIEEANKECIKISNAVDAGVRCGLQVNAGHGLHYHNVAAIAEILPIKELNIGHAIIARAALTGLGEAVREMKKLMEDARLLAVTVAGK